MSYEPDYESLRQHTVPDWFHNAKLGVMIVWGLFSVPAWAPTTGDINEVVAREGWERLFERNPYAEWYRNTIKFAASPSHQYHVQTYGEDFDYDNFVPIFNRAVEKWNPDEWARLFEQGHIRYVVFLTKHHDGFLLWPSEHPNPYKKGYQTKRDIPRELASAIGRRGMHMGLYYSGGLDWSFKDELIHDHKSVYTTIPQQPEYVEYANAHWRELIDRYEPLVLWNDIGYPAAANLPELFAYYYNKVPDGVINDRFGQVVPESAPTDADVLLNPASPHFDFRTPEYTSYKRIMEMKWETTRGIGHSFSYNQNEGPADHLPVSALVRMLVDIVSKNGNLLLSVGPMADGIIPVLQRERLEGLGAWLAVNGEAIFETRPWVEAEGCTVEGIPLRYTQKGQALYATLLDTPGPQVTIQGLGATEGTTVQLLGHDRALSWSQDGDTIAITFPNALPEAPAHALKLVPAPRLTAYNT